MFKLLPVIILSLAWIVAAAPAGSAKVDPPSGFNVTSLTFTGSGCPPGTAYYALDADRTALTAVFSELYAEIGPGIPVSSNRKQCQLSFGVLVPEGYSFGISVIDYHSSYLLDEGVTVAQRTAYSFDGEAADATAQSTLSGPLTLDLYITHERFSPVVFSPCGKAVAFKVDTQVALTKGSSTVPMNPLDTSGYLAEIFNLEWRKC